MLLDLLSKVYLLLFVYLVLLLNWLILVMLMCYYISCIWDESVWYPVGQHTAGIGWVCFQPPLSVVCGHRLQVRATLELHGEMMCTEVRNDDMIRLSILILACPNSSCNYSGFVWYAMGHDHGAWPCFCKGRSWHLRVKCNHKTLVEMFSLFACSHIWWYDYIII